ncbi:DUF1254 domain-containing protein [Marinobacter sp. DY40_1A1]|nr:DUF1254 domain-containing protein [Marinobacter sp. DY40_1A1]
MRGWSICSMVCAMLVLGTSAYAEQTTPGYNHKIPTKILTPDEVETPIGTLNFFDGMPDSATVEKVYDNLDLIRGTETFLNGIPATSIEGMRLGFRDIGADASNKAVIMDKLLDSSPLFLTGNTDTVYCMAFLDLKKDGATVVEIPAKSAPGTVDDAYFRFVTDMGVTGPDAGEGGKYLILPPDYDGDLNPPEGGMKAVVDGETYFVSKSTSYINLLFLRGFLVDGKPDVATAMFENGLKIYPLRDAGNPPKMEFISGSGKSFNTIHANNFDFYEELHTVIEREPVSMLDPQLRGLFASIGIEKGKPFNPDARMKKILTQAVAIGNATARAIVFRPRLEGFSYYPGSGWGTGFVGSSYQWLKDGGKGGRNLDARALFFYQATVNTPAMVMEMVGKGSQYAATTVDKNGDYLYGDKTYRLKIPGNVPAADFWSVVIYDPQTRSELQTSQPFPSKNSKRDALQENADGSVDLYFAPKAPEGKEANWIQTVPGKGWYPILRLYGPLKPWFDKTWRPGELESISGVDSSREMPAVLVGEGATVTAIVVAVDWDNRALVLRTEDDELIRLEVSEEARNFPQVRAGDRVVVAYSIGVALALSPSDASNGMRERVDTVTLDRTELGQKPGGTLRSTIHATGVVRAIDPELRTVTFDGAEHTVTLAVDEDIDLPNIHVGDQVDALYQESLAISVEPAVGHPVLK